MIHWYRTFGGIGSFVTDLGDEAPGPPDYELDGRRVVTDPDVVRAMFDPVRGTILDLLLERAATVGELATALDRPRSTVAHHVDVLVEADLVRVVRTRRVRAIDERFYGRTARHFQVGRIDPELATGLTNDLVVAAGASADAHAADDLRVALRHARIPADVAGEFWDRVLDLVDDFTAHARAGDTTYGLVVGLYPTDAPALPPIDPDD